MSGQKTVIITGANSGIGFEASRIFCREGYDLILACRNETAANEAINRLKKEHPSATVTFIKLDLSSLASVRQFAENFLKKGKSLHILVNNAGIIGQNTRTVTEDGFELTMATNHLGHFLLTSLLLDNLKKTAADTGEARVVILTSIGHSSEIANKMPGPKVVPLDMEDIYLEKENAYKTWKQGYKNSKLANILFMYELNRRLQGSGVTVNAMCPGFIPATGLIRSQSSCMRCFLTCCLDKCFKCCSVTRSAVEGGTDIFRLSTDESYKGVSGKYYSSGEEAEASEEARDLAKQQALWEISEKCIQEKSPQQG